MKRRRTFADLINALYFNPFIERVFHTSIYCLKRELHGCNSVLDLGCGPYSGVQFARVPYTVGVDVFPPYIKESSRRGLHTSYVRARLPHVEFSPKSFDAVVMIEVLEHLSESEGLELLNKAAVWARKRVVVTTPNGFLPQSDIDGNPYQAHRSGWSVARMRGLGFRAYGMAGARLLRKENAAVVTGDSESIYGTIRWRPRRFWLVTSETSQLMTYFMPRMAFEVFYVRDIGSPTGTSA